MNAKHHEKEAYIIAQAGRLGAVTIATNMAGRGTDILLGGNAEYLAKSNLDEQGIDESNPDYENLKNQALEQAREITEKEHEQVVNAGGLHVIGTERHESRRIDNQLRGRAARQGDPGSTRFFLSLEDNLMRIFGGEAIKNLMNMLNLPENTAIDHPMITKRIKSAQKRVETFHFDIRKQVLDYDDVINIQREKFYHQRKKVLSGRGLYSDIIYMIEQEVDWMFLETRYQEMKVEEYNYEELEKMVKELHSIVPPLAGVIEVKDIQNMRYAPMYEKVKDFVIQAYKDHEIEIIEFYNKVLADYNSDTPAQEPFSDDNVVRQLEKDILLKVVDAKWIDHLTNVRMIQDSIGLRAYGQKDPLIEYKKECFDLFNRMMYEIQSETVQYLFRTRFGIQVVNPDDIDPDMMV